MDEPFGFLSTTPLSNDVLSQKWDTVRQKAESEASVLSRCATKDKCPAAAQQFIKIIVEGREHQGLARVGVVNRAVNLSE